MRKQPDRYFQEAMRFLRDRTNTPSESHILQLLIRAAVMFPPAAEVLVTAPFRTRADRRLAVIRAMSAIIISEENEHESAWQRRGNLRHRWRGV